MRRRNLVIAGAAAAATVSAAYDLWLWLTSYLSDNFHNDFTFYFAAARVGVIHGGKYIYDLNLQQEQLDAIGSHITIAQLARYVSPPPLSWFVTVLTPLPYQPAYWIWCALLVIALAYTWYVAAPAAGRSRVIFLVAAVGWLPVIYGLQLGQPALLVAASVVMCYAFLRDRQPIWAGAVLGLIVFKPQLAILVPPALLVAGRWRAFVASAVALAALAVLSLIDLGSHGVNAYLAILRFATTVPENQAQTLAAWLPNLVVTRAVQAVIALWTLAVVYRLRHRDPRVWLAVALVGGLAASPYVHYDDLVMLGVAALFFIGATRGVWPRVAAVVFFVLGEGFPIWGAGPILASELLVLLLLSVPALEHHYGDAQQDEAEGEHDADLDGDGQHLAVDGQAQAVDRGARQA